ncbi:Amidase 1 [Lasiodiplodia theobromae]|uniref:Amidase 1 n=1 Tax=Lasiodiplodia theobromae TaxID=45133 RepID=A0A5N5D3A9_9PEZI|nr:Amidase 1 [Lasiodiplodia theobromae]
MASTFSMAVFARYSALLAAFVASSNAALSSTGFTVSLDDVPYYIAPNAIATINITKGFPSGSKSGFFTPITVINTDDVGFSGAIFDSVVSNWTETDDVFQSGFLQGVYVQYTGPSYSSAKQAPKLNLGNVSVLTAHVATANAVPEGPYFISSSGDLYQPWRLYSDIMGAFSETTIPNADGSFSVLPANIQGQSLAVAVPSRLSYTKTPEKPLAGVRLGVKDIYDIAGMRTSNGNRAWYHFYPEANTTALAVQRLVDAGAIIVGKMKTSQFANGERATADWVDYLSPFNPRGDGYQQPSSSSSGPGAGEGAYEWLDITLGSDTGGSVRGPSQAQGLYGNRPSHGLVELTNVMPLAPELDTAGLLCRDPSIWTAAAKAMYSTNITISSSYPKQILLADFPTETGEYESDALLLDFVSKLSSFLGANATAFNITEAWATDNPDTTPVEELLNITYPLLIAKEQTQLVRDPWYAEYAAANDGRLPFVDPAPLARWAYGDNSSATIAEAVANKTQFMTWFNSSVLAPDAETCSSSLLLYIGGTEADVSYRNLYLSSPSVPFGFSTSRISVFSEAPDMVVPIGQASYFSSITNHTEVLPVTVDFMAAKGCDGMIFSLVEDLVAEGIISVSKAGRSTVDGGQILLRRSEVVQ